MAVPLGPPHPCPARPGVAAAVPEAVGAGLCGPYLHPAAAPLATAAQGRAVGGGHQARQRTHNGRQVYDYMRLD